MPSAKTGKIQGKFKKGQSGNPDGRPKGARNKATLAVEALLDGDAERLTKVAIKKALGGDTTALRLCLDRIAPPTKDRTVQIALPSIRDADDVAAASAKIIQSIARGEIGIASGETLLRLLDSHRRVLESAELERRVLALEAALVQSR